MKNRKNHANKRKMQRLPKQSVPAKRLSERMKKPSGRKKNQSERKLVPIKQDTNIILDRAEVRKKAQSLRDEAAIDIVGVRSENVPAFAPEQMEQDSQSISSNLDTKQDSQPVSNSPSEEPGSRQNPDSSNVNNPAQAETTPVQTSVPIPNPPETDSGGSAQTPLRKAEIELGQAQKSKSRSKHDRHRVFPILWWALGAICLLAAGGLIWWHFYRPMPLAEETTISEGGTDDQGVESAEEQGSEESPDEKTPAPPTAEQPTTAPIESIKEEPAPIAPRPVNTSDPDVTPGSKVVALTFDDGPSAVTTPRLLDILKGRNVKATFFVLGTMAQRSPDLLRRELAEGHEVASHTPYHHQLTTLSWDQVHAEALEMDRIFQEILGKVPPFTRPPYGAFNTSVGSALGQPMIIWNVDPRDWADRNAGIVRTRVVQATRDGSIVLLHDIHSTTIDAVPGIIDDLRAQGYEFLTVSELAALRDIPLVSGQAYYGF